MVITFCLILNLKTLFCNTKNSTLILFFLFENLNIESSLTVVPMDAEQAFMINNLKNNERKGPLNKFGKRGENKHTKIKFGKY